MSNDPSGYLRSSFTFTYKLSALEVALKYMYVKKKKKKAMTLESSMKIP